MLDINFNSNIRILLYSSLFAFLGCVNAPTPETVEKETVTAVNIDSLTSIVTGHFDPSTHPDFVVIDSVYADRPGLYLHKDALAAYIQMWQAAKADGIDLVIRSATRNFVYQKGIWERKWNGETLLEGHLDARTIADASERALQILRYSSMPGTSRHHWGTDIDLNAFDNAYFESGQGLKVFNWLQQHAASFGFCRPYTAFDEVRTSGYQEEKWHWSFMPLSVPLTQFAATHLKDTQIQQFAGSDVASNIEIVKNYVLGVHPSCKTK